MGPTPDFFWVNPCRAAGALGHYRAAERSGAMRAAASVFLVFVFCFASPQIVLVRKIEATGTQQKEEFTHSAKKEHT